VIDGTVLLQSPRVTAFLAALEHARDEDFINAPGLGTVRVKHVRWGMDRGVVVVHSSGMGLAIAQPDQHGACAHCKGKKGEQPCEHCACFMCTFFRRCEERASPRVSRAKMMELARQLQRFTFGAAPAPNAPSLDDDIL
jgi:hypothetical protein